MSMFEHLNLWNLKRKSSPWSVILLLLATAPKPAAALDLVVQSTVGEPGTSVQIPINLASRGASVAAVVFEVEYDLTKLEFEGSSSQAALPADARNGHTVGTVKHSAETGRIGMAAYDALAPVEPFQDGPLTALQFKIRPRAEGFAAVRIAAQPAADAADAAGRRVEVGPPAAGATGVFITSVQPEVVVSPASVSFGSLVSGQTEERMVSVGNLGTAAATLATVRIEPNDSAFQLTSSPVTPRLLGPGESLVLALRFSRFGEGSYTASLVIEQAAPSATRLEVPLSASVVAEGSFAYPSRLLVPAVARRTDADGWRWRSAAALFNPTDRTISTLLTVVQGQTAPVTREVRLAASESRVWEDLALELFDAEEASGAVIVHSSSPDLVLRSTLVRERDGGGYAAHAVPVVGWQGLLRFTDTIYLAAMEQSQDQRTTLSLLNLGDEPITIRVELVGNEVASGQRLYVVEPGQAIDEVGFLDDIGAQSLPHAVMRIKVLTPSALYYVYATTVDRRSGTIILQPAR